MSLQETYLGLANKTRTFFAAVLAQYDPDWIVKVDDDMYLLVDRLLLAAEQWNKMGAG